jgi:hypothetical protein
MPEKTIPIMLALRCANHWATSAPDGTKPTAHTPTAVNTPVITYRCHTSVMRLASTHETPMMTAPVRITRRGPTRSTNVPTTGDSTPCTMDDSEKAPAARPRDQRNSSSSGTRKTENENISPKAMPSVSQTVTMRSHGEVEPAAAGAVTLQRRIRRLPRPALDSAWPAGR